MFDDYLQPACDCFPEVEGRWPCEACGLRHAWSCPKISGVRDRKAEPKLYEVGGPLGGVVARGKVKRKETNDG